MALLWGLRHGLLWATLLAAVVSLSALPRPRRATPEEVSAAVDWIVDTSLKMRDSLVAKRGSPASALRGLASAAVAGHEAHEVDDFWKRRPSDVARLTALAGAAVDMPTKDSELCFFLPSLRDDIVWASRAQEGPHDASSLLQMTSEALGMSACCRTRVQHELKISLLALLSQSEQWRLMLGWRDIFGCLEWAWWGPGGGVHHDWTGIRGKLMSAVLNSHSFWLYLPVEALSVQMAFMPLCLYNSRLDGPCMVKICKCVDYVIMHAADHLAVAGEDARALEAFELAQAAPGLLPALLSGSGGVGGVAQWDSFYNMPATYLPEAAYWPWWQSHPHIAPVVEFLESNFNVIAAERANVEDDEELKRDIYPVTNLDKVWVGLNFLQNHGTWREDKCKLAPRTCEAVRQQGILRRGEHDLLTSACSRVDDMILEKVMWTVVEPEARFAAHSGETFRINVQMCVHGCEQAELRVNGTVVPYVKGRALAWQDSFRHEVTNHGSEARWVFQITLAHPDYRRVSEEACRDREQMLRLFREKPRQALRHLEQTFSPFAHRAVCGSHGGRGGSCPAEDWPQETARTGAFDSMQASAEDCFATEDQFQSCCCFEKTRCAAAMDGFREWRKCCGHLLRACPLPEVSV